MKEKAFWEARQRGRAEGVLAGARRFCLALVRQHHPEIADSLAPHIDGCTDVPRLGRWSMAAGDLPAEELAALVGRAAARRVANTSAPRRRTLRPRPRRIAGSR